MLRHVTNEMLMFSGHLLTIRCGTKTRRLKYECVERIADVHVVWMWFISLRMKFVLILTKNNGHHI